MNRIRNAGGFTLVETMIALVVVSILGIAMANLFRAQNQVHNRQNKGVERTMNARAAVDMIARDVRNAGYDPRGTADAGFVDLDTQAVEWTADLNGDGDAEDLAAPLEEHVRIAFDEDSGEIRRTVGDVETVLVDHVTVFELTYLDKDLNPTFEAMEVEQITIQMEYDTDDGSMPGALETQVAIRNRIYVPEESVCSVEAAMVIQGELEIKKDSSILGCSKSIHVNGDLKLGGDIVVAGDVSVTGEVTSGGDKIEDEDGNAVEAEEGVGSTEVAEHSNPYTSHCAEADYLLQSNGKVKVVATGVEHTATATAQFGWKRTATGPVVWDFQGDVGFPGTFCVEGNAKISGNPGKNDGSPVSMSVFASGSIEVKGKKSYLTAHDANGYLFMAGGDLFLEAEIVGVKTNYTGNVYAYSQCETKGEMVVNGQIMCRDAATPGDAKEHATKNKFDAEMTWTYACGGGC